MIAGLIFSVHATAEDKKANKPTKPTPVDSSAKTSSPMTQEEIVQSFEKYSQKWEKFLKTGQVAFNKQKFSKSHTGYIFDVAKYTLHGSVNYDVKKTESLVSPYDAYMTVKLRKDSPKNCPGEFSVGGWSNLDGLLKALNDSCYGPDGITPFDEVRLNFAMQRGIWVWKSAIRTKYNNPEIYISGALGDDGEAGFPLPEQNKHWLQLLEK